MLPHNVSHLSSILNDHPGVSWKVSARGGLKIAAIRELRNSKNEPVGLYEAKCLIEEYQSNAAHYDANSFSPVVSPVVSTVTLDNGSFIRITRLSSGEHLIEKITHTRIVMDSCNLLQAVADFAVSP